MLAKEAAEGFLDKAVIGGLDSFLTRWEGELKPVLGNYPSYSSRTPEERKDWAKRAIDKINAAPVPAANGATSATPAKPSTPSRKTAGKLAAPIKLSDPVTVLRYVTDKTVPKLKRLGVERVEDLIYLFPHRHSDYSKIRTVSELKFGEEQTVVVNVWEATETQLGSKRSTQAVMGDDTGNVRVTWFNQPWVARTLKVNDRIVLSGKATAFRGAFVFENPEYEVLAGQEDLLHTGRLVPVYPLVEGLYQRSLRGYVKQALDGALTHVGEYLPDSTRHRTGLSGIRNAISGMHFPSGKEDLESSRRRLAFDELFMLQMAVMSRKQAWQVEETGVALKVDREMLFAFQRSLPFNLTDAQARVLNEVLGDIQSTKPMSRLLQGDVGSGKTVVAFMALLMAVANGYQGALVAPTAILAEQHFLSIRRMLSGKPTVALSDNVIAVTYEGLPRPLVIGLLLGSLSQKVKREIQQQASSGEIDLVIGTHAVLQDSVALPRLAIAVVDEQHRFGVMQRAALREKGTRPHLLAMSATPIPRSLQLTLYGELDVSAIDEMPPGRQRIRTRWVEPDRRQSAYNFIRAQVELGRQAFVVCPFIEGSEAVQTRAAVEEYERLSKQVFRELKLGLLHGKMPLREKAAAMEQFVQGKTNILVSTPVVEVGIDVPNATVMLIDGADRFGLAQLHQFRGRVGRGKFESYCLLLADEPGEEARKRLKLVEHLSDGFELAEEDLKLRGPGDYLGTRQSGLPSLRVAKLSDQDIIAMARAEARHILESDPDLARPEHAALAQRLKAYEAGLTDEMS